MKRSLDISKFQSEDRNVPVTKKRLQAAKYSINTYSILNVFCDELNQPSHQVYSFLQPVVCISLTQSKLFNINFSLE